MERIESSYTTSARGSSAEILAGAAAIVLAILGLMGLSPASLASIGVIVLGAGFLMAAMGASTGMDTEVVLGGIAVVLGVLALLGVGRELLLPISAIVLGAALLFAGMTARRLEGEGGSHALTRSASGVELLIGLAVIVLGIIGLTGNMPITLTLVSVLGLGGTLLLAGLAIGGRVHVRRQVHEHEITTPRAPQPHS
jgi:hypothetical protein